MNLRFAKMLRTHRREDDLIAWKEELIKKETTRPETADVVMVIFDYQMNQYKYEDMIITAQDLVKLYENNNEKVRNTESYTLARKNLIETAAKLQEYTLKNKNATQVPTLMKTLSAVYTAFIQIVAEDDPRISQAHYNLAETLFVIHDYNKATDHYRWVLTHWNKKNGFIYPDIELKAIASRYETLRNSKLIPEELKSTKLDHRSEKDLAGKLDKSLYEWIGWIDSFSGKTPQSRTALESFQFEANRSIYQNGSTRVATDRLIAFALNAPESKYGIPSASLALDTYIISEEWKESYELSHRLMKKKWKQDDFFKKLKETAENSSYKLTEQKFLTKQYEDAIHDAEKLLKEFPSGIRTGDSLVLMAQSSLALNKKADAEKYYTQLIQDLPQSKDRETALLARAQLAEESYRYPLAIQDYNLYLKLKSNDIKTEQKDQIQKRIYFLSWISGELSVTCSTSKDSDDDESSEIKTECLKYQALSWLMNEKLAQTVDSDQAEKFVKYSLKGPKENRPLWAAVALKFAKELEYRERLVMIRVLSNGWEKLEPLVRFSLIPIMSETIPSTLTLARTELKKVVPLNKATTQSITRRVEWIKEIETTATKSLSLPWGRIRTLALLELSLVYLDFSKTLADLPLPKEISPEEIAEYKKTVQEIIDPFTAKGREIAQRSYQVGSESAVEPTVLAQILSLFPDFSKSSSEALQKKIPSFATYSQVQPLNLALLERLDPSSDWKLSNKNSSKNSQDIPTRLKRSWLEAYSSKAWTKVGFILQELNEKKAVSPSLLKILRSLSLAGMGAQAEALLELQSASEDLEPRIRNDVHLILVSYYIQALSLDHSSRMVQAIEKYLAAQKEAKKNE
jgi:TolA-binding protein